MEDSIDVTQLAGQLIAIPSFVDTNNDECELVEFLENFLKRQLPQLSVERQQLPTSKRANLIVRGRGKTDVLVVGHIDTVQPKDGWETDPFAATIRSGSLYGLGASDMKGSLAAFLAALCDFAKQGDLSRLAILLYVDEEYEFKGMKQFLTSKTVKAMRPRLILSLDGGPQPASGCRGLIELALTVKGKSGHAANPENGVNAITETIAAVNETRLSLSKFQDRYLGATTCNVAYIRGGARRSVDGQIRWQQEGNVIADTAELIFEVRPATTKVTAAKVAKMLEANLNARGLTVEQATTKHDLSLIHI